MSTETSLSLIFPDVLHKRGISGRVLSNFHRDILFRRFWITATNQPKVIPNTINRK
jgi:hypothetical protein